MAKQRMKRIKKDQTQNWVGVSWEPFCDTESMITGCQCPESFAGSEVASLSGERPVISSST